jgi:hypothetical protein
MKHCLFCCDDSVGLGRHYDLNLKFLGERRNVSRGQPSRRSTVGRISRPEFVEAWRMKRVQQGGDGQDGVDRDVELANEDEEERGMLPSRYEMIGRRLTVDLVRGLPAIQSRLLREG